MQQLKKENALLLKLVTTLQSQTNSKTRENQLLFQQYDQLASQNHNMETQIASLKQENRDLRRNSLTPKDQPRYTYAVLNSPRTEKLETQILTLKNSLNTSVIEGQRLTKEVERLNIELSRVNLQLTTCTREREEMESRRSKERMSVLQRNLMKKEKEMKELTLIMYAKDATTSEFTLRQEEKNKEIELLRSQIATVKEQKEQKYRELKEKEEKVIEVSTQKDLQIDKLRAEVQGLEIQLQREQENSRKIIQMNSKLEKDMKTLQGENQIMKSELKERMASLQNLKNQKQSEDTVTINSLKQELKIKEIEISQLQSINAIRSQNLSELSLFMNQQAQELQSALEKVQELSTQSEKQTLHKHQVLEQQLRNELEGQLSQKKLILANLQQKIIQTQSQYKKHESKLHDIHKSIQELQSFKLDNKKERERLSSQIQNCRIEVASLKLEKETLAKDILQDKLESNRVKEAFIHSKHEVEVQRQKLKQLSAKIEQSQSVLNDLLKDSQCVETVMHQNKQLHEQMQEIRRELQEKDQSAIAFMDVLDNLQEEVKVKDSQLEELQLKLKSSVDCFALASITSNKETSMQVIIQKLMECAENSKSSEFTSFIEQLKQLYLSEQQNLCLQNEAIRQSLSNLVIQHQHLKKKTEETSAKLHESLENERILRNQLQNSIKAHTQVQQLQLRSNPLKDAQNKRSTDNFQREQYIQMLSAVIESIKNEHEQSITKIQCKNTIIHELETRLERAEDNYKKEISILRNSIATCQEALNYEQLVEQYRGSSIASRSHEINQEEVAELLKEVESLREQVKAKDEQLKTYSQSKQLFRSQNEDKARDESNSAIDEESNPSQERPSQDNNLRPISTIHPPQRTSLPHHYSSQSEQPPSQSYIQNQQLQETVEQQNQVIIQLQDQLIRMQNGYNSEIINYKRSIAELTGQILLLKKKLYESNPKSFDVASFVKDSSLLPKEGSKYKNEVSRLHSQLRSNSNQFRPPSLKNNSFHAQHPSQRPFYEKASTYSTYTAQKSRRSQVDSSPCPVEKATPKPPPSRSPKVQSNPYISMMTNERGELKFPESGNWSIEELRAILQQPPP